MACLLVAMVNYNSAGYVRECLRSIQDVVARIVVVDNASTSAPARSPAPRCGVPRPGEPAA